MTRSYWENPGRTNPELEATRDRWNERFCMSLAPTETPRRPLSFWVFMGVQLAACSLPILLLLAVTG